MADRYYTNQYTGDKIITWKNFTDTSTPLSAANLQKSHSAINAVDQSVRAAFNSVDNTKLDKTAAASMISDIEFNQTTGVLIFHHYDTSIPDIVFNTNLQKVVVNFTYDTATQSLVLTQADNTVVRIDLSDFISTPDVANSDTVAWTINQDGSVSADIIDGSITEDKLEEHYLESILDQVATVSRLTNNSEYFSKLAKSYANGTSNLSDRPNENVDNSKYYMEQSQRSAIICGSILHIAGEKASDSEAYGAGTRDGVPVSSDDPAYHNNSKYYMEEAKEAVIEHLPVMTGATATTDGQQGAAPKPLAGDQDKVLHGDGTWRTVTSGTTDYPNLTNKPSINNVTLSGNKTGTQLGLQNIILSSTLSIGGQTVTEVEEALGSLAGISKPMTGATSSAAGEGGFVPSPSAGDENKALFGDGTWKSVSGGGGHTILDEDGVTYPQRSKLQFEGCEVTDDSTNGITKIKAEGGVTGVKGNAETDYRTGNVNLTPAHVGAVDEVEYEEDIYGVNVIDFSVYTSMSNASNRGITWTNNGGTWYATGTTTGYAYVNFYVVETFPFTIKANESFIVSGLPNVSGAKFVIAWYETAGGTQQILRFDNGELIEPVNYDRNCTIQIALTNTGVTVDNAVFRPMLRKATIQDDTYRPYNQQSIQHQLTEQTNVLGAKNLIPYPYADGESLTDNGITYIVNADGSITANGTATATSHFYMRSYGKVPFELKAGTYQLNGCPTGGGQSIYAIRYNYSTGGSGIIAAQDNGEGAIFTLDVNRELSGVYLIIWQGVTVNNLTFKPMLRLASDPDDTYVPYAMTNRELTEGVQGVQSTLRRTRKNITSSLSNLSTAVSEQDLGKYGYTIGDYFTGASGYTYTLADMNTFKGTATPFCITGNHLGIVVATHATSKWHTGSASSVGYNGSTLHSYLKGTVLTNIKSDLTALFGDWNSHLLAHSKLLTTATAAWGWQVDQYISALTCTQVDGGSQWTANGYQEGEASKSLELFRKYKWTEIFGNEYVWLRNISNHDTSAGFACDAGTDGCLSGRGGVTHDYSVAGLIIFN